MTMKTEEFFYNGYKATVLVPDKPNGKWIWKTEFFHAFEAAEVALSERGYTRVYYEISNKYGSYKAVRLMRGFQDYVTGKYGFTAKPVLFGFSRGGLYAFNYALFYPDRVDKIYLDAPVLDMKTWPWHGSAEQGEMCKEYCLSAETLPFFSDNPVDNLKEFFDNGIPLLLVAGDADDVVSFERNAQRVIKYCERNGINLEYFVKPDCNHHPHSLKDVKPIIDFVEKPHD